MRKFKLPMIAFAALALTLASCEKDNGGNGPVFAGKGVITFEDAALNESGYLVNFTYSEGPAAFAHNYTAAEPSPYWDGFAVSDNTDTETAGWSNQYSVYAAAGAGNSSKFGIAYVVGTADIIFSSSAGCEVEYIYVNNSTYAALSIKNGDDYTEPFGDGDWFKLTIAGYGTDGAKTDEKEVYLANYLGAEPLVMDEWTKVELSSLGKVAKLSFSLSSTDNGEWGMNTPAYFCIDDIAYSKYEKAE